MTIVTLLKIRKSAGARSGAPSLLSPPVIHAQPSRRAWRRPGRKGSGGPPRTPLATTQASPLARFWPRAQETPSKLGARAKKQL